MTDALWLGGFIFTLYLVAMSWTSGRWWPLPYCWACVFGFGTCLVAFTWPQWLRDGWCDLGIIYAVVLPIARTVRRRHRAVWGEW